MGKWVNMRKEMGAESSKTCQQSHSFIQANYWTEYRCRIPVKADSKDKDVDNHTVSTHLEGQSPQKQIPQLHTIITSRYITHAHTHALRDPVYTAMWSSCHTHGKQGTVEWVEFLCSYQWGQIFHLPITVCVRMFCVWACVYKHASHQIPLSPAVAFWDIPPTPNGVGSVLLSQWHQADESCAPH